MSLLVLLAAGVVLGIWTLRPFALRLSIESASVALLIGLALAADIILVIGSWSLSASQLTIFLIAFFGVAFELQRRVRHGAASAHASVTAMEPPATAVDFIALAAVVSALLIAAVSSLAPSTSWDAAVAHLALPADYTREGHIYAFQGNPYSAYPLLVHCLYTWAFNLGGESSALQMSWWLAVLALAAVYGLAKRVESRRCGLFAAALLATAPIFFDQAGMASIDLAFVAFATAALGAFVAWRQEDRTGWLAASAFLAGSSCGVRHTGYIVGLLLFLAVAVTARNRRWQSLGIFCGLACLGAAPWMIRTTLVTGDPFYPFFTSLLSHNPIPDAQRTSFGTHPSIRGVGWKDLLMFPWNIVMRPDRYDGWSKSPGALVLWLGVPGLVVGGRRARWLGAYAIAGGLFFFYFQQNARYILPFFVAMMIVAAIAAIRLTPLRKGIHGLLVFTFAFGLCLGAASVSFKLPVVLGLETRDEYLASRVEYYPVFVWINENIPPNDTVLTVYTRSYYIHGRTYHNYEALIQLVGKPIDKQLEWLRRHDIRYVLYLENFTQDERYYVETGVAGMLNQWEMSRQYFDLVHEMYVPDPRTGKLEHAEILKLRDNVLPDAPREPAP